MRDPTYGSGSAVRAAEISRGEVCVRVGVSCPSAAAPLELRPVYSVIVGPDDRYEDCSRRKVL